MLYRLVGLLCGIALFSFALSWWFQIPVLALALQLLLLLKKVKWSVIGISFRSSLLAFLKKLHIDFGSGLLKRWSRGLGLEHALTALKKSVVGIFKKTIGAFFIWMGKRGFGTRLAVSLLITGGIIWLSVWFSIFWVLFIFLPAEVTLVFNLLLSSIWKAVSNTGLLKASQAVVRWVSRTKIGIGIQKLNDAFEQKIGVKIERHGASQRKKLSRTKTGRKFLSWLDRFAPTKPPRQRPSRNPFANGTIRSFQKQNSGFSRDKLRHRPK